MRSVFTAIFLAFGFLTCFGQEQNESVPFIAYWAKGDSYDFRITKIKQQWKDGLIVKDDSSSYEVNFVVLDSTDINYRIRWTYLTNLSEFNIPDELVDKFSKFQITEVVYSTNENGEFLGIDNWQEISEMMKGLFSEILDEIELNQTEKPEDFKLKMQPFLDVYNSREGIEQLVFKELQFFHFPFGYEFSVKEPLFFEEQLPNMFGGNPLNAESKIYIEEVNFEDSFCVMIKEMKLNPEDTKLMLGALFKNMKVEEEKLAELMENAKIEINDHNRFEYFFYPGVPYFVETNRETFVEIDGEIGKRIEKIKIELLQ